MKINADFDKRVVVHGAQMDWIDSPMPGVSRRPLDRVGEEVARATSIVRYQPGSHFSSHIHTGGEEFFVLEGVFQDEHGDFPAGSYLRNPPTSSHTPGSELGCVIFVKLWQFRPDDRTHVRLDSNFLHPVPHRLHAGVSVTPLYKDRFEEVELQVWEPNAQVILDAAQGIEVLVLSGQFVESGETLVTQSWIRLPIGSKLNAKSGPKGATLWVKKNGLAQVNDEVAFLTQR